MAKKSEVVKKTKTTKRVAASGEKPVVKNRQTKPAATRKPTAAPKPPAKPRTRKTASNQPRKEDKNFVVYGTVTYADGSPAEGATVIAYDKDDSGKDILGQPVVTTATGSFSISYSAADFRKSKKEIGGADVIVCVYNAKQELLFTSKKKNNAPAKYELNITLPAEQFVVRGKVTDANQKPLANMTVRAFDCDLRKEEPLGKETRTNQHGHYEIPYTREDFTRAEKEAADIKVRIYALDSENEPMSSEIVFNALADQKIDLQLPEATTGKVSVWEQITQVVLPLLANQGENGEALLPLQLDDKDIDFIVKESGLDREQLRLWALADKFAHEYELINAETLRPKRRATRNQVSNAAVGSNFTSQEIGELLERICFFGWFLNDHPQNFNLLVRRSTEDLIASLDRAVAQNHIPPLDEKLKAIVSQALESRRVVEEIKPSAEGEPASFGDVLNIAVGNNDVYRAMTKKLAPDIHRLIQAADIFSSDFVMELDKTVQDKSFSAQIANSFRLSEIALGHRPMLEALSKNVSATEPTVQIAIAPLANMDKLAWIEAVYQHGTPQDSVLTPEQYAEHLHENVEKAAPATVLQRVLESHSLFTSQQQNNELGAVIDNHASSNTLSAPHVRLYKALKQHPTTDIIGRDIDELAKDMGLDTDTSKLLGKFTHLKRLDARWDEAATLMEGGLNHVGQIVDFGRKGFESVMDEKIASHRIDSIWQHAQKTQALSIGLMGYLQPMLYGTTVAVKESHRNSPKAKKLIAENPTLAKLFGSIDSCYCDPCLSVLSPAAYLADLLKFIDYSKDTLNDVDAGRVLRTRRPDIFDLELSCDNSKVELPHIDLVNEILENAIALPYDVLLPRGTKPDDELSKPQIEGALLVALQSTSADTLVNLVGQRDVSNLAAEFGVSHWIVSDRFRRWTVTAANEYLGLIPMDRAGIDLSRVDKDELFATISNEGTLDLLDVQLLLPLLRQSLGMNELPLAITEIKSQQLANKNNLQRWGLNIKAEGTVEIILGSGGYGAIRLVAQNGQPASRAFQILRTIVQDTAIRLDAGQFSTELRNLCGIFLKTKIAVTKIGPTRWRYSIALNKIQLAYRPTSLRISSIAYQSSDISKDLFLKPQNRNPRAYIALDDTGLVFPWSLPYDAALQETRALLEKVTLPRLSWLNALTTSSRRSEAPAILQELLGLSLRQYELIKTEAVGNKSYWGVDATSELVLLRKVSEVLQRARLSFVELQNLLESTIVNPGKVFTIDMRNGCDPALMVLAGSDSGFPGLLDRLHRYVRLWRALDWDSKTLDRALNPTQSSTVNLNENSLLTLAHLMATSRLLNVQVARLCDWFSANTSNASTARPARELQLAQALGLSAEEYATARQLLSWAFALQSTNFPFDSPANLRRFVEEVQFVKTSRQSWEVLSYALLHSGPDFDALHWTEARTRQWLTTLHSQSALPLPEARAENTHETPQEMERRWLRWGLTKPAVTNGPWSVVDPDDERQRLTNTHPLQLLSRIKVLSRQTNISVPLLKVCLLSPAVNDPGQTTLSIGTANGIETVSGLLVKHLDRLQRVNSWLQTTNPLLCTVSHLAQEMGADLSVVEELLDQPLRNNTTSPASHDLLNFLLENPLRDLDDAAIRLPLHDILARVHKLLLLNKSWQGDSEHLRWLKPNPEPRFIGLRPLSLATVSITTGQASAALYQEWKQTTTLLSLAKIGSGMTRVLEAYRHAESDSPTALPTTFPRWTVLAEAFRLVDTSGLAQSRAVGLLAQQLGDLPAKRLDPIWLNDLCAALALVQRFGANSATTVENIIRIGAARPNNDTVSAARMLLQRLGDDACKETLSSVENNLREERRDRLVDFLLWRERDHLRDVNALYEHYLIDPQMSSCMNTTRLLQATAAAQLFVQRCLMNLENQDSDPVPPSLIDINRWKWARNYRVWEANRKVFIYPENWLFPEVRDDRTETFKAFESTLTQSEPSHENAVTALRQYLDGLVEVSQISVMGMYEHAIEKYKRTLYLVGRSPNSPYTYYWRKAHNYGEPGMRWAGWGRIDQDLSSDHIVPFVFDGDFHIAWPLIKLINEGNVDYYEVHLAWARKTATGWTKRNASRDPLKVKRPFYRDERSLFAFKYVHQGDLAAIACCVATPPIPENDPPPFYYDEAGTLPAEVGKPKTTFVSDSEKTNATHIKLKMHLFGWTVFRGSNNPVPTKTKYVPTDVAIYSPRVSNGGEINLFLQGGALKTHKFFVIPLGEAYLGLGSNAQLCSVELPYSSSQIPKSLDVTVKVVFEGGPNTDNQISGETQLEMASVKQFQFCPGIDGVWKPSDTALSFTPPGNLFSWSSGFREPQFSISGLPAVFTQSDTGQFFALQANRPDAGLTSLPRFWYIEEGTVRFFARETPTQSAGLSVFPAGFDDPRKYKTSFATSLNSLYSLPMQQAPVNTVFGLGKLGTYFPLQLPNKWDPRSLNMPAFDLQMPYANYNWEVFYHLPIAVATFLSRQHRFEDARRWFHFIFDPTTNDASTGRERFWRFLPFRQAQAPDTITQLLEVLAKPQANVQKKSEVEAQITAWLDDPFNPFAIARLRPSAFEWYTVISYVKNLIAWADQMFRRDSRESINEATLLYIMAAQILGPRPETIRTQETNRQSFSYRSLKELKGDLDSFSNVWLTLADSPYGQSLLNDINTLDAQRRFDPDLENEFAQLSSIGSLYFCVPPNEKLPELWDMVDDRLFKIRHCQNIEGVRRELALYEPPIDPELLIRAKAAGMDWADVLADRFAPLPHYRFQVLLQKANEFCNEVKSLGGAILSAIEKKEAEQLSLLRSSQEIEMLKLIESIKKEQIKEAQANIASLGKTKRNAIDRFTFLQHQLGKTEIKFDASDSPIVEQSLMSHVQESGAPDGFHSLSLIHSEIEQVLRLQDGHVWTMVAGGTKIGAAALKGSASLATAYPPVADTLSKLAEAASYVSDASSLIASNASFWEKRSGLIAGWQRRRDEWVQQSRMTAEEIRQIDKQIIALEIRKSITEKELDNHRTQIEHAKNIDDFMRHIKFTGESLYGWMESQLSGLYFSAYQMAYDLAKKAERAYQFELGDSSSTFVQFGHWDSLRKGLLSGDRLSHNLRRMEAAYLDRNKRELEITKHVSLRQLDGLALIRLRAEGECEFEIPEAVFDLDFPGHYFRRIKSVSISVPCVVGPYTSVNGTLTLLSSRLREKSVPSVSYDDESNYRSSYLPIQSISTSTGQNDSGLFELNFRDERYLPFEGGGAISSWRFKLPGEFRAFDYNSISDVILHIRYTARNGGEPLANSAKAAVRSLHQLTGLVQVLSLRHEYPTEWSQLQSGVDGTICITLDKARFPYFVSGETVSLIRFGALARVRTPTQSSDAQGVFCLKLTKVNGTSTASPGFPDRPNLGNWRKNDQGGDIKNGPVTVSTISENAQWELKLLSSAQSTAVIDKQHRALLEDIVLLVGYRI